MMMSQRGRSVEPELFAMASTSGSGGPPAMVAARPQYLSRRQMRARSAGPASSNRYDMIHLLISNEYIYKFLILIK